MRKYCKAYLVKDFKKFKNWKVNEANLRKETRNVDGKEVEAPRRLSDDDILYLHEDFVVTDGIYREEHVIFDAVTDEWKEFCRQVLKFSVPDFGGETRKAESKESG
ncbi:MAG: hypothetical protein GXO78_11495 [Calditrichaeota bacterium]|nr:hypothetical protein [Calditrichota bacterium]